MRASPGDCPRSFATPRPLSGAQCLDVFCCFLTLIPIRLQSTTLYAVPADVCFPWC